MKDNTAKIIPFFNSLFLAINNVVHRTIVNKTWVADNLDLAIRAHLKDER